VTAEAPTAGGGVLEFPAWVVEALGRFESDWRSAGGGHHRIPLFVVPPAQAPLGDWTTAAERLLGDLDLNT